MLHGALLSFFCPLLVRIWTKHDKGIWNYGTFHILIYILEIYLLHSQNIFLRPCLQVNTPLDFVPSCICFACGCEYPTKSDLPGICKSHQLLNFMEQVSKVLLVYTTTLLTALCGSFSKMWSESHQCNVSYIQCVRSNKCRERWPCATEGFQHFTTMPSTLFWCNPNMPELHEL